MVFIGFLKIKKMLHFDIFRILEAIFELKTLISIFKKCKFLPTLYQLIVSASNIAWQACTSKFRYIDILIQP